MSDTTYLSITELTSQFNESLQAHFPVVSFKGEISQCTRASSGHVYFTVKDEKSQLAAVMWRGVASSLSFDPKQGMEVLCQGKPNIYSGSGKFQVVVHRMEQAGEGLLQRRFLELKAKLEKEGLFDESRKRPIPFLPSRIGIVTSKSGAAIHDIMTKIQERMPNVPTVLYDARVQGDGSAEEIVAGIEYFQKEGRCDVLIIGRGGGSLEDLWSFNEEIVVRAVFASHVPVICAVGHEVDVSLSDMAADVRAPTPTAAGEMVVPRREDLLRELNRYEQKFLNFDSWFYPFAQKVDDLDQRLRGSISFRVEQCRAQLERARGNLSTIRPDRFLGQLKSKLHELELLLKERMQRRVRSEDARLAQCERVLARCDPTRLVMAAKEQVQSLEHQLKQGLAFRLREETQKLREFYKMLQALNYEKVLRRGFSLVSSEGKLVRSASDVELGQKLEIRFGEGEAEAKVSALKIEGVVAKEKKKGEPPKNSKQGALFS